MLTGRRIGVYQIQTLLGAGGMGEVYRARDTKLGRDVAIKILPEMFTTDPDRLARFEREARMLAALNHPNIGAIYGVEEADRQARAGCARAGAGTGGRRDAGGEARPRLRLQTVRPEARARGHGTGRSPLSVSDEPSASPARSPTRSTRRTRRGSSIAT